MNDIEKLIDDLQQSPTAWVDIRNKFRSLPPEAFPPVPVNREVEMKSKKHWDERSLYRREELCTHRYREAIMDVLQKCGVQFDEFLMSEIIKRPDLQERLLGIIAPERDGDLYPDVHAVVTFVRDGVRARLLIEKLIANGIVVLEGVEKRDERGIIDCFKRSSLDLSLDILEEDMRSERGRYIIKPYIGQHVWYHNSSMMTFRYCLEDTHGKFNEGFYFHQGKWHMATLEIGA